MDMRDLRHLGIDNHLLSTLQDMLDFSDDVDKPAHPSKAYLRDAKAMAATPADVKEYHNSYVIVIDMPGIAAADIKVQIEDDSVLVVSGVRKREKEKEEGVKYLKMERRLGKFMRKFPLPENADVDAVSAGSCEGVLTVTVQKRPPPEPKTPRRIDVEVGG